jgi:hypothetical protein
MLMNKKHTPASLPDWLIHSPQQWQAATLSRARLYAKARELRSHPNMDDAQRAYADNAITTFQSQWLLNKLMRESGRYAFLIFVIGLHHTRDKTDPAAGITYSRLMQLFARGSLASSRRLKAMLVLARLGGLLKFATAQPQDKRIKVLVPTEKLINAVLPWFTGLLAAAAIVKPQLADVVAAPPPVRAMVMQEVMSYFMHAYERSQFTIHESYPVLQFFVSREHGFVVLMKLILQMQLCPDGTYQTSISHSALADRFAISRGTVRNILDAAAAQGWLTCSGRGGHVVVLSQDFADICANWVALDLEWAGELALFAYRSMDR